MHPYRAQELRRHIGLVFIGPFAFGGVLLAQARSAAADWQLHLALTNDRKIPLVRGGDPEIDEALIKLDAFLEDNELGLPR